MSLFEDHKALLTQRWNLGISENANYQYPQVVGISGFLSVFKKSQHYKQGIGKLTPRNFSGFTLPRFECYSSPWNPQKVIDHLGVQKGEEYRFENGFYELVVDTFTYY